MRRFVLLLPLVAACGAKTISVSGPSGAPVVTPRPREYRPRFPAVTCEDQFHDGDLERGCRKGEARSCFLYFEKVWRTPAGVEPRETLRALCEKNRTDVCACGMYAEALQYDPATEREALVRLDDACVHGYLEACDVADLAAELCLYQRSPACADLAEQGRVHVPTDDDAMSDTPLAQELRGCWIVGSVASCEGNGPCAWSAPVGTLVCFDADRISTHAPGAPWDQVAGGWKGYRGVGIFRPSARGFGSRLALDGSGAKFGRASLERAPASAMSEARGLPFVKDVCARARRCRDLASAQLRPQSTIDDDSPGTLDDVQFPDTLLRCAELERQIRAKFPGC